MQVKEEKKLLRPYFRPYWFHYWLCTSLGAVGIFLQFSSIGVFLQQILRLSTGDSAFTDWSSLLGYLLLLLAAPLLAGFSAVGLQRVCQRTECRMRSDLMKAWLHADASDRSISQNDFLNRLNVDLPAVSGLNGWNMSGFIDEPILSGALSLVVLGVIDLRIAAICLLCSLLHLGAVRLLVNRRVQLEQEITRQKSNTASWLLEGLDGRVEIRSFHLQNWFMDRLGKRLPLLQRAIFRYERIASLRSSLISFIGDCFTILTILLTGAWLAQRGIVSFANVMLAIPLSDQISQMMVAIGYRNVLFEEAIPHVERIFAVLQLKPAKPVVGSQRIAFSHVCFSYGEKEVLHDVSFRVAPGSHFALAGASGSGKSTIMKLLMGQLEPDKGIIQHPDPHTFAWMPQDSKLFHVSISENIAMSLQPDPARVRQAARQAHADDFIQEKAGGYDFVAETKDEGFSNGQMQRLSLARALYRHPAVILMDEPTAALDPASAADIQREIDSLPADITVIVITHHLAFLQNFDHICFIENGRITDEGSWQDLMNHCESFRQMQILQEKQME